MKKILLILAVGFFSLPLLAEEKTESKEVNIVVFGVASHREYRDVVNGIKRITGVVSLIPSRLSSKAIELSGFLSDEATMFENDIKAFATDRFQVEVKESGRLVKVTLKKL